MNLKHLQLKLWIQKKTNTPFKSNKSTLANMKWKFRKFVTKSTTKTIDHFVSYINLQGYALQKQVIDFIQGDAENKILNEENVILEKISEMVMYLKESWGEKSELIYTLLTINFSHIAK